MKINLAFTSLSILLLVLLFSAKTVAQQRFKAAAVLGFNAAQVNGDAYAGYDKIGIRGGLRGITVLTPKSEFSFDILYSQRGSYERLPRGSVGLPRRIRLNYIEVPVLFTIKDWLEAEDNYYRIQAHAGLSFSRLIAATAIDYDQIASEVDFFAQNDFGFTLGASYFATPKLGFSGFYSRSINRLYNNQDYILDNGFPRFPFPLIGYFITFQVVRLF